MNNEETFVVPEPEAQPYYEQVVEPIAVESIVVEPEPEVVPEPVAAAEEKPAKSKKSPDADAAADFADGEVVLLSSLKFEAIARNSRSVGLVQNRLFQLGHTSAYEDSAGWLSVGTRSALADFCGCDEASVKVDDEELIKRLFAGTSVKVS